VGDTIPLKGTIYPGNWELVVRGIYDGRQSSTNTATLFFHWDYVNETIKKIIPRRANQIGVYVGRSTSRKMPPRFPPPWTGNSPTRWPKR
jgi:putative ABC transport system permease protein